MNIHFKQSLVDKREIEDCKTSQARLNVGFYMMSVSDVQLKMNVAFLWLREALCCKLVSKGDWQITSQPACKSNLVPLKPHTTDLSHWLCTFLYQSHFVMLPYANSNILTFITLSFFLMIVCLAIKFVCTYWGFHAKLPFLHEMRTTVKERQIREPASKTLHRYPVKIHGNTRNRNVDWPWPPHHNFPPVH